MTLPTIPGPPYPVVIPARTLAAKRAKAKRRAKRDRKELEREPLQVMIDNMIYWDRLAQSLSAQLDALVVNTPDACREAQAIVKDFLRARDKSQECAEAAAPYRHSRFHTIAPPPKPADSMATVDFASLDPVEASLAYQRLIKGTG